MPDSFTDRLALTKPEVGASRDTWGSKLNQDLDIIDEFLGTVMPIGAVLDFAGTTAPDGFLICDGRLVSRTTYSALFAVIGTVWGAGDGSTTFGLPRCPGRASVAPGAMIDEVGVTTTFTFGSYRGAVARPIAQANLPATAIWTDERGWHGHGGVTYNAGSHSHSTDVQGLHNHDTGGTAGGASPGGTHSHGGWTGTDGDHNHHITTLPNESAGTSGGGYPVMSSVFGSGDYLTSVAGAHSHSIGTYDGGLHQHYLYWDGGHGHNISAVGDHAHNLSIYGDGNHQHTITLGSGTWFDIMSPVVVVTKIIYAGQQASTRTIPGTAGVAPARHLAAPTRGRH